MMIVLLKLLHREASFVTWQLKFLSDGKVLRPQRSCYRSFSEKLEQLWDSYDANKIKSCHKLLSACSLLFSPKCWMLDNRSTVSACINCNVSSLSLSRLLLCCIIIILTMQWTIRAYSHTNLMFRHCRILMTHLLMGFIWCKYYTNYAMNYLFLVSSLFSIIGLHSNNTQTIYCRPIDFFAVAQTT